MHYILFFFIILVSACQGPKLPIQPPTTEKISETISIDSLPNNIWYIFNDSKGHYWFGSDGDGVFRYDGKKTTQFTTKDGLPNDRIRQIKEDKEGNIFFSTLDGICKFDGTTIAKLKPIENDNWRLHPDDLWFCMLGRSAEKGVYRYDGENLFHHSLPKHYLHDELLKDEINPMFSAYEVYNIYKDRKGHIWFGTSIMGLCRYDGTSVKWMYERELTIVPAGGSFGIRSTYEDRNGNFWICNTNQLFRFDNDKTNKSDRLVYDKLPGVGNRAIVGDIDIYYSHIVEDNGGHIWLTTWGHGIYKYNGKDLTHYPVIDNGKNVNVVSMYKDRKGELWLGTSEHGVYKFDGKQFQNVNVN